MDPRSDTLLWETAVAKALAMKPGQRMIIGRDVLNAFPGRFDGIPATNALLECLPGSAWGSYRLERRHDRGDYILFRDAPGDERVYLDWDRGGRLNPDIATARAAKEKK